MRKYAVIEKISEPFEGTAITFGNIVASFR